MARAGGLRPAYTLILYIAVFAVIYWAIHVGAAAIKPGFDLSDPRDKVVFAACTSIMLLWTAFLAMLLALRLRGQRLADLGWGKRASVWGWLTATVVAVAYGGMMLVFGPLKTQPYMTDWSLFRVATALAIGITAGICEETIFRGFVMTQARDAGLPTVVQVLLSALLFGVAHVGWGSFSGEINVGATVGAVGGTAVLGALMAGVYLLSRRSLTPAILAHGAIDLAIEPWLLLLALSGGFNQS